MTMVQCDSFTHPTSSVPFFPVLIVSRVLSCVVTRVPGSRDPSLLTGRNLPTTKCIRWGAGSSASALGRKPCCKRRLRIQADFAPSKSNAIVRMHSEAFVFIDRYTLARPRNQTCGFNNIDRMYA